MIALLLQFSSVKRSLFTAAILMGCTCLHAQDLDHDNGSCWSLDGDVEDVCHQTFRETLQALDAVPGDDNDLNPSESFDEENAPSWFDIAFTDDAEENEEEAQALLQQQAAHKQLFLTLDQTTALQMYHEHKEKMRMHRVSQDLARDSSRFPETTVYAFEAHEVLQEPTMDQKLPSQEDVMEALHPSETMTLALESGKNSNGPTRTSPERPSLEGASGNANVKEEQPLRESIEQVPAQSTIHTSAKDANGLEGASGNAEVIRVVEQQPVVPKVKPAESVTPQNMHAVSEPIPSSLEGVNCETEVHEAYSEPKEIVISRNNAWSKECKPAYHETWDEAEEAMCCAMAEFDPCEQEAFDAEDQFYTAEILSENTDFAYEEAEIEEALYEPPVSLEGAFCDAQTLDSRCLPEQPHGMQMPLSRKLSGPVPQSLPKQTVGSARQAPGCPAVQPLSDTQSQHPSLEEVASATSIIDAIEPWESWEKKPEEMGSAIAVAMPPKTMGSVAEAPKPDISNPGIADFEYSIDSSAAQGQVVHMETAWQDWRNNQEQIGLSQASAQQKAVLLPKLGVLDTLPKSEITVTDPGIANLPSAVNAAVAVTLPAIYEEPSMKPDQTELIGSLNSEADVAKMARLSEKRMKIGVVDKKQKSERLEAGIDGRVPIAAQFEGSHVPTKGLLTPQHDTLLAQATPIDNDIPMNTDVNVFEPPIKAPAAPAPATPMTSAPAPVNAAPIKAIPAQSAEPITTAPAQPVPETNAAPAQPVFTAAPAQPAAPPAIQAQPVPIQAQPVPITAAPAQPATPAAAPAIAPAVPVTITPVSAPANPNAPDDAKSILTPAFNQPPRTAAQEGAPASKGFLINFTNVGIIEYIRFISRITGKNFIFDDAELQFNVTIVSEQPTTIENIMAALMQELRIHGLSLIEQGNDLIIHTNANVNSPGKIIVHGEDKTATVETRVFTLESLDPVTMAAVLKPLLSNQSIIEPMANSNNIIVTDIEPNIEKVAQLIKSLDSTTGGYEVGQYVVRNTIPEALIALAVKIMTPIAQNKELVLVPHAPTNSIFIVSSPNLVRQTMIILQSLDVSEASTRLLPLEHAVPTGQLPGGGEGGQFGPGGRPIEPVITGAVPNPAGGPGGPGGGQGGPGGPNAPGNILGPQGLPGQAPISPEILTRNPKWTSELPLGHIQNTQFYIHKLHYRQGDQIENALQKIATSLAESGVANADLITTIRSIQWIESSNSLVFTGTRDSIEKVKELIEEIDTPLREVFIEMLILDTTIDESMNFGVDWGTRFGAQNVMGSQAFLPSLSTLLNPLDTASLLGPVSLDPSQIARNEGFSIGVIGRHITHCGLSFNSIGAIISALHIDDETNIVLNPKIIVEDNSPAEIFVGINAPFKTQSIANDIGSVLTNNFEYRDIGASIKVTPYLGSDQIITLDIDEEISSVAGTQGISSITGTEISQLNITLTGGPTILKNNSKTRLHVPNDYFVIMSGMIQDQNTRNREQVPCLGAVPILGGLFSRKNGFDTKRNIMLFIRPHIIDTDDDFDEITKRQQDIYHEKTRKKNSWKYELDETLDFLNIENTVLKEDDCAYGK